MQVHHQPDYAISFLQQRQLIKRLVFEHKYESAYNILLDLLSVYPNDFEILSQIGYVTYLLQLYNESLSYYKQCIEINNQQIDNSFISNWFSYHQYAKLLHFHCNEHQNAKLYYLKSLKLNEENIPIYYDLAKLHQDMQRFDEAHSYFEQFFDLIEFHKARNLKRMKCMQDYLDVAHYEYALLLFYRVDRKFNGKQHLQMAIDLKPEHAEYHHALAAMHKLCQSLKKARKHYLQCIELTQEKKHSYLYEYGIFLTDALKDTQQGIVYVKKALDLQPANQQYKDEYLALKNWNEYQAKLRQQQQVPACKEDSKTEENNTSDQDDVDEEDEHDVDDDDHDDDDDQVDERKPDEVASSHSGYAHNHSDNTVAEQAVSTTTTATTRSRGKKYHRKSSTQRAHSLPWNASDYAGNSNHNREIYNSIKRDARRIKFDDSSHGTASTTTTTNGSHSAGGIDGGQQSIDWDKICGKNDKYSSRILEFKAKFKIACQAQAEHNYVLAKNILEDLIKIAPEDGEIFGRYAFALAQLNNLYEAEKYYKKSLILSPRNYVTMYNYAFLLYYKLQRYEEAEVLYKKCLKIKPNCAKALLNYARLLDTVKKKKLSEQYYRMCLSGSPNYDLCFYYFGCFLYRQERYEEAKYFLQKAVNCWPHSHLHHFRLAVTCHILGEYEKCDHHLKEALRIKPNFEAAMEAFERYGYGKITKQKQNGKVQFNEFKRGRRFHANHHRHAQPQRSRQRQPPPPQEHVHFNHHNHHKPPPPHNHQYYVKKSYEDGPPRQEDAHFVANNDTMMIHRRQQQYQQHSAMLHLDRDHEHEATNGERSDTPNTLSTTTPTDAEKEAEHSPDSAQSNGTASTSNKQRLRMYDPVRRNHRFNINEKWVDDSNTIRHCSDDKKYFINWLKSIRLYDEVKPMFARSGIDTMKHFHAQIPSKQALFARLESAGLRESKSSAHRMDINQMVNIIWESAPKHSSSQSSKKKAFAHWTS